MENGIIPWRKPFNTSLSPIPTNFSIAYVIVFLYTNDLLIFSRMCVRHLPEWTDR